MINKVNSVSFNGKIIDSHVHTGQWRVNNRITDYGAGVDTFTKQPLPNGDTVEKVVASNLDCMVYASNWGEPMRFASDEIKGNERILEYADKNPKIAPLATCQPGVGNVENIRTLFKDNPDRFVGLKFHPEQLLLPADRPEYKPYLEFANEKKLPCLFHSGQSFDVHYPDGGISPASKYSRPKQIYDAAKSYPEVPVIMAHLGGNSGENTMEAVDCIIESVKKGDAKLYADISWVDCDNPQKPTLKQTIQKLKDVNALDRIMFGTDAPLGRFGLDGENGVAPLKAYTDNVDDIKSMIKREFPDESKEITEKLFYKNAEKLYFPDKSSKPKKHLPNKSAGAFIAGAALLIAGGAYLINHLNKNNKPEKIINQ